MADADGPRIEGEPERDVQVTGAQSPNLRARPSVRPEGQSGVQVLPACRTPVPGDVYEDLLDRYERALVFAGQLQEKNRQQSLLQEKNGELERQVEELRKRVALEEGYSRLLENALRAVGVLAS
ncbi:MAG: hypothetical protein HYX74_08650 [Acidobacteria bacterium]|nr:hypothetical protein [Acidobacteriota bacterium]